MSATSIVALNGSAAVVLPPEVLRSLGVGIGDAVEIAVADDQMILRRISDPARQKLVEQLTREIFEERRDAYQRLA